MNQVIPSGLCYTPVAVLPREALPVARNAGAGTLTRATTDLEAITSWLQRHIDSPCTLSSYRREAERLLLWMQAQAQPRALQQLTVEDLLAYRAFLKDPQPRARWCLQQEPRTLDDGSPNPNWKLVRTVSRTLPTGEPNPNWRPFVSGLSATACAQAETIIFGMFEFLAGVGYLAANPLRAIRRRQPREKREISRYLDEDLWAWLMGYIERMPRETPRERAHANRISFLVGILYLTGLRISEMAAARTDHLVHRRGQWWLRVPNGKGGVDADVPLPTDAEQLLRDYRMSLGREPWPHPDLAEPLVMSITGTRPVTVKALHHIITTFFENAALEASPEHAKVLRDASCHWLRHTDASHQISAGVPLIVVRDNLRHASVTTTEGYVHTNRDQQHLHTQKHQLRREP